MAYRARIPIRFGDTDQAGIVYYPNFFHIFHVAFEEFFRDCVGLAYDRVIREDRVGFPVVHVECDFKRPLRHGDIAEVELTFEKVGESSASCHYRAYRVGTGELCAEARIVNVAVEMGSFKSIPLPPQIAKAFRAHLEKE